MKYRGTKRADVYAGTADADQIVGLGGDDRLAGGSGNDQVAGGDGADSVEGGAGDDVLFSGGLFAVPGHVYPGLTLPLDRGAELDALSGGDGNDVLVAGIGDTVDGGAGTDTLLLSLAGADAGVTLSVRGLVSGGTVKVAGGTVSGVEEVRFLEATAFADEIDARRLGDHLLVLDAGAGDDHVVFDGRFGAIRGGDGDDLLEGVGKDRSAEFDGGAGDDRLLGAKTATGDDGDDTITAYQEADGGAGNDIIGGLVGGKPSYIHFAALGGDGDDTITGSAEGESLQGEAGADILRGGGGDDYLWSGSNERLDTDRMHDVAEGGDGDDVVSVGFGDDASGGAGSDTLELSLAGALRGVTLDAAAIVRGETVTLGGGTLSGFERMAPLTATRWADDLTVGGNGSAIMTFDAGDGNDRVTLVGASSGTMGGGDDVVSYLSGTSPVGVGTLADGGAGADTFDFSQADGAVNVHLDWYTAGYFSFGNMTGFETIVGSAFADTFSSEALTGTRLLGGAGDDRLISGDGDDRLEGGTGNDDLRSGYGADLLLGGDGDDTLFVTDADGDTLGGGAGLDTLSGWSLDLSGAALAGDIETISLTGTLTIAAGQQAGVSRIAAQALTVAGAGTLDFRTVAVTCAVTLSALGNRVLFDGASHQVFGGAGTDAIATGGGADELHGGGGNDVIDAGSGAAGTAANRLFGDDGNDRLIGGAGADVFDGGTGGDLMIGGKGDYRYVDVRRPTQSLKTWTAASTRSRPASTACCAPTSRIWC